MPTDPTAPPPPELLALIEAVRDRPWEAEPRLALAAWLAKRKQGSDVARAKFIRQQVKREKDAVGREAATWIDHSVWEQLGGPLFEFTEAEGYMTGMPMLRLGVDPWAPEWVALLPSEFFAFVYSVRMTQLTADGFERLAALPELRYVNGLNFATQNATADALTCLFASPHLTGLRYLGVGWPGATDAHMRALAQNPALAKLGTLVLLAKEVTDEGIAALAESPHLKLASLSLSLSQVSAVGADTLIHSPGFSTLQSLYISDSHLLSTYATEQLRAKFGRINGQSDDED